MPKKFFLGILFLLLSLGASCQVVVRLAPEAEVVGPQILLGELGEIQGEEELVRSLSQTPVGVAPGPGESRTISLNADLAPRLRRAGYRPQDFTWEGPSTVRVVGKVDSEKIAQLKAELESGLLAYLNTHPRGQLFSWQVEILPGTIPIWAQEEGRLILRKDELPVGKVPLVVEVLPSRRTFSCQASISAWGRVLVTERELASGSILTEEMVRKSQELDLSSYLQEGKLPLLELDENLELNRSLAPDTILTWEDVDYPLLVRRGDAVTIFVEQGPVQIEAPGRALVDGRLGARIKVMNTSSERVVEGIVVDRGFIRVGR